MSEFTDAELERYSRQIVLPQFGGLGQRRLKAARVVVVGAGGIGSAVIPALAGAGVGRLTIVDSDHVDLANLHRQPVFNEADIGTLKAEAAARFAAGLNGTIRVEARTQRIGVGNAAELVGSHDLVIDGSDNFATRLAVSDACVVLGIPLLSAAAVQFQGQVGLFRGRPCYRCFVGDAFDSEDCDTCAELGVLGALTGTVGNYAALIAVRALAGMADDAGTLHLFDAAGLKWRAIRVPADPVCTACAAMGFRPSLPSRS